MRRFGVTPVVAINAFADDHDSEHEVILQTCEELGRPVRGQPPRRRGRSRARRLWPTRCSRRSTEGSDFRFLYDLSMPLVEKIETIATQIYGADGIDLSPAAAKGLADYERLGFGELPVVIAKTHLSISSDPKLRGAPTGWRLPVREVRLAAGAGYVYAICGDMRTMPGLPSPPQRRADRPRRGRQRRRAVLTGSPHGSHGSHREGLPVTCRSLQRPTRDRIPGQPGIPTRGRATPTAQARDSRAIGQLMHRGPPRPEPSSEPAIRTTSMPASSSRSLVSSLRS